MLDAEPRPLITLDTEHEPWVGRFEGLGEVTVDVAGTVTVSAESAEARDALQWGWAEVLSLHRRGFMLLTAACAQPSETQSCVLITGAAHEVGRVVVALAADGWRLMADRVTPGTWDQEQLLAHPREAPIVAARRRAAEAGVDAAPIRQDSDVVIVEAARSLAPAPVGALVQVSARAYGEAPFALIEGRARFETVRTLWLGGVFADPERGEASTMVDSMRLVTLPMASLRLSKDSDAQSIQSAMNGWLT